MPDPFTVATAAATLARGCRAPVCTQQLLTGSPQFMGMRQVSAPPVPQLGPPLWVSGDLAISASSLVCKAGVVQTHLMDASWGQCISKAG